MPAGIKYWSTNANSNTSLPPYGAGEGMRPSQVNDVIRQQMSDHATQWRIDGPWVDWNHTPTRTGNNTFTVSGDQTSVYTVGRRIRCTDSATIYATITGSSYSAPNTTVTTSNDAAANFSASLSAIALSIFDAVHSPFPTSILNDGDYGDVTISGSGTIITIDNSAVTYAKIQNVSATDKLLGRSTAGAGVIEEITCTAFGRSLIDDADAATARSTLGLVIGTNVQAFDATLTALAAYNTNGIVCQTAADTFAGRTITGTANRTTITNGDGVLGNPTIDISSSYVGQSTITTLGTITTGVWNGTIITSAFGGTGNGFTKFSGPATTEKTFTLPNATCTILTTNAAVTVAQGGTGVSTLTTAYGVICAGTTATGNVQTVTPGTNAGQIFQSGGVSALPTWSTPTYPSASGSSGKIIRSNGTNNVYSTVTFPDTGTSQKILAGDGTNYVEKSLSTSIRIFTAASTSYTPTSGTIFAFVQCIGAGGAGGGVSSGTGSLAVGGGGGGGGYSASWLSAASLAGSPTITVGQAVAGSTGAGSNGGDTSFGALVIGKGGTGGTNGGSVTAASATAGGAGGVAGTGDITFPGMAGGAGYNLVAYATTMLAVGGPGGESGRAFGMGHGPTGSLAGSGSANAGAGGNNYGGGGGGAARHNVASTASGGGGAAGICIVTEYILS